MSEDQSNAVRSKTDKSGSHIKLYSSLRTCALGACASGKIITVSAAINKILPALPEVICNLIAVIASPVCNGDNPTLDLPIGYVELHQKTRRCHHVVCIPCFRLIVHDACERHVDMIECPKKGCVRHIYYTEINEKIVT